MRPQSKGETIVLILAFIALVHAVVILVMWIDNPIVGFRSSRQAQTALSAYWLVQGGDWLRYETPILGAPWAVPFEFPFYQLLTAGLANLGIPLTAAGRIVAFGFYLGALWPLSSFFRTLGLSRIGYYATSILFVTCPLYLFFGRAFLIESCALFFALLWLSLFVKLVGKPSISLALGTTVAGSLAILVKSTTFPAFTAVGGLIAAAALFRIWRDRTAASHMVKLIVVLAGTTSIIYAVGLGWIYYTDQVKLENELGSALTAAALQGWNFGSWAQRLSARLWIGTIFNRVLPETLGYLFPLGLLMLCAPVGSRHTQKAVMIAVFGFLFPLLVFTNLHIVHNYYQSANAIFLLAAIGISIGQLFDRMSRPVAIIVIAAIAGGQAAYFHQRFGKSLMESEDSTNRLWRLAEIARSTTTPDQSLLLIGMGWNSAVAYNAQRKALAIPGWPRGKALDKILADPQRFLDGYPLGAIVYCPSNTYGEASAQIAAFLKGRKVLGEYKACQVLAPQR
jgi:hypothetical protein